MVINLEPQLLFQHTTSVGLILLNIIFFSLDFFSLSGTKYIHILEMHQSQFWKNTYSKEYDLILNQFTIFANLLAWNY